jgi:Zn finger protein HypA/HybF involved in hydrogenase expression
MHHESKVIESILKQCTNAKKVKVLVGEFSGYTVEEIKRALEARIDCEVEEEKGIVKCECGFEGSPTILEKEHDFVFFECPMCNQIPEILKGKEVIVKDICV